MQSHKKPTDKRARLESSFKAAYQDFSQLYPRLKVKDLTYEQLYKIVSERQPIQKVLGEPETPTIYHIIRCNFPYLNADLFSLPQNQLERLARGDSPEKVLEPKKYQPASSKTKTFEQILKETERKIMVFENKDSRGFGTHGRSYNDTCRHTYNNRISRRGFNPRED